MTSNGSLKVRLVFVDQGEYHREEVRLSADLLDGYDRLIDCLREEPEVLKQIYVDVGRLCAAYLVEGPEAGSDAGRSDSAGTEALLPFQTVV